MSILVVGISHRTAPVAVLEQLVLDADGLGKLLLDVTASEHVHESVVIATCNRLEVYAEVDRFHGSVEEISRLMVERADAGTASMIPHLYVHYDDAAVSHLFQVSAGLDSMAVGEGQILGQTREALRAGQEHGTAGTALNSLFQQALRVGKRAHAETDLDRAAPSLVAAGLEALDAPLTGRSVLVLGAGSMAALTVATATRAGAGQVVVINRTDANADRLATEYGVTSRPFDELAAAIADTDVLVTCTGAHDVLVGTDVVGDRSARHLDVVDLALPHDVSPEVDRLAGVTLVNLAELSCRLTGTDGLSGTDATGDAVAAAREIVAAEVSAFLTARRQASVAPTVVALRSMATAVVDAELRRLDARLPDLDPSVRTELAHAVRRVADKLLHQPTVRVKELADQDGGAVSYAAALAELFALDPDAVDSVTRPGGVR